MKEDAEVESEAGYIASKLTLGPLGEALGRLELEDDSPGDQHVRAVEADLLAPERDADWELPVDAESLVPKSYLDRSQVQRLDEPIPKLIIHIKETADDDAAQLLLDGYWAREG
jgi:hypothetical protein